MSDFVISAKVTGDSSGFQKAIATAQSTLSSFNSKMSSFGKSISSVGNTLTNKLTKPALAATSALAGITLVKGFNRLVGIDDARAKLTALGHDAESVEAIMDSALQSVQGTAFGLDEAATTAANAVAAGIKPGQELTEYLTMTADAAAIAGTSLSEMGSIINKVQTGQTVYTEDLEQLADRGLPVYQWLADEAGVAASEVKQLASDGQISSQMLFSAIEKNVGGAAKIMGETSFSAALDNIGASISRIGANFLDAGGQGGGFFSQLKPLMADFSEMLGGLEVKASELGVKFGAAFADLVTKVQGLKAQFDALPESVQSTILKVAGIGAAVTVGIGPALKIVGPLVTAFGGIAKAVSLILNPVGLVVTAIAGLAAVFTHLMNTNSEFNAAVTQTWGAVQEKITSVINAIKPILSTAFDGVQQALQSVLPSFSTIFSTIQQVVGTVSTVISAFISGLSSGFQSGLSSVTGFVGGFTSLFGAISPVLQTFSGTFGAIIPQIQNLANIISANLVPVFTTLGTTIGGIASATIPAILSVMSNLIPVIMQIATTVMNLASSILPVVVSLINQLAPFITKIAKTIGDVVSSLAPMISQLVGSLLPVISNIVAVVMNIITSAMPALIAIMNVVMSIIQAVVPVVTNILSVVISVISGIISALSPIVSIVGAIITAIMAVVSPIVSFIGNVIAGIISVVGTVVGAVSDVFATVFSIVTDVFSSISNFIATIITTISTVISTLTGIVGGVFNSIYSVVSSIMSNVSSVISGVLSGIQSAWNGLTGFVSGVFSGISGAVSSLVESVKGFVNGVISGINSAISVINKIPGVSIGSIPYLASGTANWQGGFAYMNEGGRGELTYLPNGSQVIPHDISVKYAKEAARSNTAAASLDLVALGDYIIAAMTEVGARQGEGLEKGISKMGLYVDGRQAGRVISDMGFVRG